MRERGWIIENTWLSEREAEAFEKSFYEEKGSAQVAEEMDIKQNTVTSMIERMKKKYRKSLNTKEIFDEVDAVE